MKNGFVEKFSVLSMEWKREGVMDGDSRGDEGNDELGCVRYNTIQYRVYVATYKLPVVQNNVSVC